MSDATFGAPADAIDVTLVEAVGLLQADLEVLRRDLAEALDDYRAVKVRSAEAAASTSAIEAGVVPLPDVIRLEATLAELAGLFSAG